MKMKFCELAEVLVKAGVAPPQEGSDFLLYVAHTPCSNLEHYLSNRGVGGGNSLYVSIPGLPCGYLLGNTGGGMNNLIALEMSRAMTAAEVDLLVPKGYELIHGSLGALITNVSPAKTTTRECKKVLSFPGQPINVETFLKEKI